MDFCAQQSFPVDQGCLRRSRNVPIQTMRVSLWAYICLWFFQPGGGFFPSRSLIITPMMLRGRRRGLVSAGSESRHGDGRGRRGAAAVEAEGCRASARAEQRHGEAP